MDSRPASTSFGKLLAVGAAVVVVAGFVAAPVSALGAPASPMSGVSGHYVHVLRAPRLPAGAHLIGAAKTSATVSGAVALAPRDQAALQRAATAVSNPRSKQYHHYIAKGSFASQYGPTPATISGVESALRGAHLSVTSVSSNGLLVHFRGTIGAAQTAFRTHLANVRLASGRVAMETTKAVSFPASVASSVVSVIGLNTLVEPTSNLRRNTHPAAVKAKTAHFTHPANSATPCVEASDAAAELGGLTDDQIAHSYGLDSLYSHGDFGAGQTVALYELEPFSRSDLQAFDTCYFPSTATTMLSHVTTKNVDGGPGTGEGSGESILDIESVAAMAPGASIEVYQAPNGNAGPLDLYNAIVQDDTADVVSTSWGECEALAQSSEPGVINVENELFEQAALQGQTVFSASGDSGADDCAEEAPTPASPTLSTDDPSTQPFVTTAGGTTTTAATEPPDEHVWNDGNLAGGAGGGVSSIWGAPSWQQPFLDTASAAHAVADGLTPCAQSPTTGALCREIPDVTANADQYTGGLTIYQDGWGTIGGTSEAAPLWAGMLAEVNASAGCSANVGFVSPSLYAVAAVPTDYKASFTDLKTGAGNNDVYNLSNGKDYATRTGFDMASGLGSPILAGPNGQAGLASYLCSLSPPAARPSITSLVPAVVNAAAPSGPLTIHGTGFTNAKALSIGGADVPAGDWSVTNGTTISVTTIPTGALALTGGVGPQDGTGRASVSVTGANGRSSIGADPASELLYVEGSDSATTKASVEGVYSFGGPMAGGNTVDVYGSGFTGGPDAGSPTVTVGGQTATDVNVIDDNELSITVPDGSGATCKSGDDTTNDVCQAQVVVDNGNGASATDTILAPYTGAVFEGTIDGGTEPACVTDNSCEIYAAPTEYDYLPTPTITSVTTTSPGDSPTWVSEQGDTIATIDGSGFDSLGFLWALVGSPTANSSQIFVLSHTPTEVQVIIPGHNPTTEPVAVKLSVQTLAGKSASTTLTYAGVPSVRGVTPPAGSDIGGTTMKVTGRGFEGVNAADGGSIQYTYLEFGVPTTQLSGYQANSDTSLTATTPENNPGLFLVQVCTLTFCSQPESESSFENSLFDFYEPGAPVVDSISAHSGPASGGNRVVITGQHLSDVREVTFGGVPSPEAFNSEQILTNGSNTEIEAVVPPGKAGRKVNVRVVTAESFYTHHAPSAPNAASTFTYKLSVASAPLDVTATKTHPLTVETHWKAPASDGGRPVLHYRVTAVALPNSAKKGAKTPPTVVVVTKHASARSATLSGLRGGWFYHVQVFAITSQGKGLPGRAPRLFFIHDPA